MMKTIDIKNDAFIKPDFSKQETVIRLHNLSKTYHIRENRAAAKKSIINPFASTKKRQIKALQSLNLEIKKGEFFGIIGRNGSGKSTLLKIIMGAIPPDKGSVVEVKGKVIRLALGMGFDPNLSTRENIYVNASIIGMSFKQIGEKFHEILEFAELENFVDTPIKFFSSGMRSRLAFSIAVHAEADIFLMDEFFGGVGDESFKEKSEAVFKQAFLEGRTILHVSHRLSTIREHCNRVLLMNKGIPVAVGSPDEILKEYQKIYRHQKPGA